MDRELARADDGSWRISLAEIDTDGPLPVPAGRHRLLTVVDGPVLGLEMGGETHVVEPQRPFALSGDGAVLMTVPEGPVRALDVVVDPQVVTAFITVLELGRTSSLPLAADQSAYVLKGEGSGTLVAGPGEVPGRRTVVVITLEHA